MPTINVHNIAMVSVLKNLVHQLPTKAIVLTAHKIAIMVADKTRVNAVLLVLTKLQPNRLTLLIPILLVMTALVAIRFKPVGNVTPDIMKRMAVVRKIVLPILVPDTLSLPVRLMQTVHLVLNKQPVVPVVELYLR